MLPRSRWLTLLNLKVPDNSPVIKLLRFPVVMVTMVVIAMYLEQIQVIFWHWEDFTVNYPIHCFNARGSSQGALVMEETTFLIIKREQVLESDLGDLLEVFQSEFLNERMWLFTQFEEDSNDCQGMLVWTHQVLWAFNQLVNNMQLHIRVMTFEQMFRSAMEMHIISFVSERT